MKILITGGSGLIGRVLTQSLHDLGHDVSILTRKINPKLGIKQYTWNPERKEMDADALSNTEIIIHLAGANIAEKRWTKKRFKELYSSRVDSAHFLYEQVKASQIPLKSFISSSAIGWYGTSTTEEVFAEEASCAEGPLAFMSEAWESAADQFLELGCSVSKVRTGIALSTQGGALPKMMMPIALGVGAPIGSGEQYMPWIHIDDLCAIFVSLVEGKLTPGTYNGVAPEHLKNKDLTKLIAKTIKRPLWLPNVPSFVLSLIFGKMSVLLLNGSRVSSEKLLKNGFEFRYSHVEPALRQLLEK